MGHTGTMTANDGDHVARGEQRGRREQGAHGEQAPGEQSRCEQGTSHEGSIILAGTPIGNVADASPRLRELLATADVIAAEDTRKLRDLTRRLQVEPAGRIRSYHEHNEAARAEELVSEATAGATVLVVSDAGMPGVSDPGYRVVRAAQQAGVAVTAVPGPSAVLTALALSGLPSDRFTFEGFVPRKPGERDRLLAALATQERTMVFFDSPRRAAATLAAMAEAFGADRRAAVCRELTKTHEQVRRGTLAELARWATDGLLGEITVVVAGAEELPADPADALQAVLSRVEGGQRLKEAVNEVAALTGAGKRELYQAALQARRLECPGRRGPEAAGTERFSPAERHGPAPVPQPPSPQPPQAPHHR